MDFPEAPGHLSEDSRRTWKELIENFDISDPEGLDILRFGLEARDRATRAREEIDKQGMTVVDKWGQVKPHPLLTAERDARASYLAALKQLGLEKDPAKMRGPGRPTNFEIQAKRMRE